MKSVVEELGSIEFPRIRVGIGKPEFENDAINYVIGAIPEEDVKVLDEATSKAAEAVIDIIKLGVDNTMNKYN